MADEKQQTLSLTDGGPEDSQQDDELTESGDENEQGAGEGCEPEEGCEDPDAATTTGKGKGKGKGKNDAAQASKPAPAKPTPAKASTEKFKYPFNVRYATDFIDLAGFVDGTEYTSAQVKEILIANGYTEFADMEPAFHRSDATNTIVITIQGNKKGVGHGR